MTPTVRGARIHHSQRLPPPAAHHCRAGRRHTRSNSTPRQILRRCTGRMPGPALRHPNAPMTLQNRPISPMPNFGLGISRLVAGKPGRAQSRQRRHCVGIEVASFDAGEAAVRPTRFPLARKVDARTHQLKNLIVALLGSDDGAERGKKSAGSRRASRPTRPTFGFRRLEFHGHRQRPNELPLSSGLFGLLSGGRCTRGGRPSPCEPYLHGTFALTVPHQWVGVRAKFLISATCGSLISCLRFSHA